MSVKSKIQALIAAANTATGESDATLTDAVQTLVDGYGQGGGYTNDDFADPTKPSGAVTSSNASDKYLLYGRKGITSLNITATGVPDFFILGGTGLTSVSAPVAFWIGANAFQNCSNLLYAIFPAGKVMFSSTFSGCSKMLAADFGGSPDSTAGFCRTSIFSACSKLNVVVLRGSTVWPLNNINVFWGTPFASGKAGGTLYVPASLISSYQSATNWSTILGYSTNSIKSIESTATDPDAPLDLTTHYADGSLIPTS